VRVLYFTRDYTPHDHRFLTALAGTGHQVFSLRLERSRERKEERPLPDGIEPLEWQGGKKPFRLRDAVPLINGLREVIQKVQPDLVHAGPIQGPAFLTAATGFKRLVSMSWGSDLLLDAGSSQGMKLITKFTLQRSILLLGDCQAVSKTARLYNMPADRIVLFPWGVDLRTFQPEGSCDIRQMPGWQDAFILLSTRSWEPIYGVDTLVKGFIGAARQVPQLRLVMLGSGSQGGELKQMLAGNGLLDRVHFGGQVANDQLPGLYRSASVYVSASHSDGSSVSLMEAMACGRPVMVSDIPGNLEWVTPGQQGWTFADGDPAALESCMVEAYQRRSELPRMGDNSLTLARGRANWPENFKILTGAYELALNLSERKAV
jgi:glycosyltransferase involved in cell wall biosynthesis